MIDPKHLNNLLNSLKHTKHVKNHDTVKGVSHGDSAMRLLSFPTNSLFLFNCRENAWFKAPGFLQS